MGTSYRAAARDRRRDAVKSTVSISAITQETAVERTASSTDHSTSSAREATSDRNGTCRPVRCAIPR